MNSIDTKDMRDEVLQPSIDNEPNAIKISLASPALIRSWSYGEVKKPETINYRTLKPEKGGLFCAQIFGPIKDYTCICGRYKRMKHKGIVCEKCGVEVTKASVRRERMGHINLQVPVAHISFLRTLPSRIAMILKLKLKVIENILYFEKNIVVDGGLTAIEVGTILNHQETEELRQQHGDTINIDSGGSAIYQMLKQMDLTDEVTKIDKLLQSTNSLLKIKKLQAHKKLLLAFIQSNQRPEWMILTCLPVIAPDMRPLVPLDGGRFASSDLNDLYRHVLNRNNRLKRLMALHAPDIILRNEKRMLQEAVDALLDNERAHKVFIHNKRPLKSLSSSLKGKQGRFRQNLLGKRVDYSGRSVITAGPELRFFECGLPKVMALDLFKPFVYAELRKSGHAHTIKGAQRIVDNKEPIVWEVLNKVVYQHPVILNRAPTLHRLSMQAFEPVLIEGKSIQLHPLVCTPFNADFDGDSMAVHIPLSIEAQLEARLLMMSSNNIRHPGTGQSIINPSQDIILGLYYASIDKTGVLGEGGVYDGYEQVKRAYDAGALHIQANIRARVNGKMYDTTAGRVLLSIILPAGIDFALINKPITSKVTRLLTKTCHDQVSNKETVTFMDHIMYQGHKYATLSGLSISLGDMAISPNKQEMVEEGIVKARENNDLAKRGLITEAACYSLNVAMWLDIQDRVKQDLAAHIAYDKDADKEMNGNFFMMDSGARGSMNQFAQISGMRGLMTKPNGSVSDMPITANFKEGLTSIEYFQGISGGRKGLIDTALKTANAGYLTRRLVDVSQSIILDTDDCGTTGSCTVNYLYRDGVVILDLASRIVGRTIAEDIHLGKGDIIKAGTLLDVNEADRIAAAKITTVRIYSPVTCESIRGVCKKCYGIDLATGREPELGFAAGITAAHSMGEPATQLTLRTTHTGGVAMGLGTAIGFTTKCEGLVDLSLARIVINRKEERLVVSHNAVLKLWDFSRAHVLEKILLPYGSKLLVHDGEQVPAGHEILIHNASIMPLISQHTGTLSFVNIIGNNRVLKQMDANIGVTCFAVVNVGAELPRLEITDHEGKVYEYTLDKGHTVYLQPDTQVQTGDILSYRSAEKVEMKTRDIVGGLPEAINILEARKPAEPLLRSTVTGEVSLVPTSASPQKLKLVITGENETMTVANMDYTLLLVEDGDKVSVGDILSDGREDPHTLLKVLGIEALHEHVITALKTLFLDNGIATNEKHMEIILRAMTRKVTVLSSNSIDYLEGDIVHIEELTRYNARLRANGLEEIQFTRVLQGITKAALSHSSFLAAASFQESDKVLIPAAIAGKVDPLYGIKENIIAGKRIPAGTGFPTTSPAARTVFNKLQEPESNEI